LLLVSKKLIRLDAEHADVLAFLPPTRNSQFFRLIEREVDSVPDEYPEAIDVSHAFNVLLANNLVLDQRRLGAGEYCYDRYFLCAMISDEDMPWDAKEIDW